MVCSQKLEYGEYCNQFIGTFHLCHRQKTPGNVHIPGCMSRRELTRQIKRADGCYPQRSVYVREPVFQPYRTMLIAHRANDIIWRKYVELAWHFVHLYIVLPYHMLIHWGSMIRCILTIEVQSSATLLNIAPVKVSEKFWIIFF